MPYLTCSNSLHVGNYTHVYSALLDVQELVAQVAALQQLVDVQASQSLLLLLLLPLFFLFGAVLLWGQRAYSTTLSLWRAHTASAFMHSYWCTHLLISDGS